MGLETFGTIALALSLTQLSIIITDFGYGLSSTYKISRNLDDKHAINNLIGSVFIGKIPLTLFASAVTIGFPILSPQYRDSMPIFMLAILPIIGQAYQANWLFIGLENLKSITLYTVGSKILYFIFIILTIKSDQDAYLVILGWGAAQILAAILSTLHLYKIGYSIRIPSFRIILEEFLSAVPFFISRLAVASYTTASTAIVSLAGPIQTAHFYACQQIYKAGAALPVNQVLYPYMAKRPNWRAFLIITACATSLLTCISSFLIFFSDDILICTLGAEFGEAKYTFSAMLFAMVFSYLATSFGYPAFSAINKLDIANRTVVIAAVFNAAVLFTLYTLDNISALTISLSVLATEILVFISRSTLLLLILKSHNKIPVK
ncbi:PST family polysaccharide transporter [Pseudomonas nitritireducens]|uniref:PST family polysaccharide transporter n=2 Tax=Pseudomonas nitroreducens TaxID=46680 RepID=A0A7W7KPD6_PSENT|nr:PST family polysaccharide transporter [Pseudomonas nitritireducens]